MTKQRTREAQYQSLIELAEMKDLQQLGLMSSQVWRDNSRDSILHRDPLAHVNESIAKTRSSEGIHA